MWCTVIFLAQALIVAVVVLKNPAPDSRYKRGALDDIKGYYDSVPGIDLTGLSEAQKNKAIREMNKESCWCSCEFTIAQCRNLDPRCQTSIRIGKSIVEKIKA